MDHSNFAIAGIGVNIVPDAGYPTITGRNNFRWAIDCQVNAIMEFAGFTPVIPERTTNPRKIKRVIFAPFFIIIYRPFFLLSTNLLRFALGGALLTKTMFGVFTVFVCSISIFRDLMVKSF